MLNQVILVGRLVYDPELRTLEDGTNVTTITLAVDRPYKNAKTGEYDTDFIKCTLWRGVAENTVTYCTKGKTVGVKARLAQRYFEYDDGKSITYPEVIADKVTFISPKNNDYKEE